MENQPTWDDEVLLISSEYKQDELGQFIKVQDNFDKVCCYKKPVGRSDHYIAGKNDIRIQEIIVVHPYEYDGETTVVFDGEILHVERNYPINNEELELHCVQKVGDSDGD